MSSSLRSCGRQAVYSYINGRKTRILKDKSEKCSCVSESLLRGAAVLFLTVKRYNGWGTWKAAPNAETDRGGGETLNLPNMLTALRFLLIPVYLIVFANGHMISAFIVFTAAGLTDVLDGYIARSRGLETTAGALLDPLADKLMLIAVIVSLLMAGIIPWAAAVLLFIRDIGMIAGSAFFHFRGKKTVKANWMGKLTTVLFYVALMFIFLELPYGVTLLWCVIAFSFVTSVMYIVKFRALNSRQTG